MARISRRAERAFVHKRHPALHASAAYPPGIPQPIPAQDATGGTHVDEQPRWTDLSPMDRAGHPRDRAEGSRRQPQQLHDLGPAATAGRRARAVRLRHGGLLRRPGEPRPPLHVPHRRVRVGPRRWRGDAGHQAGAYIRLAERGGQYGHLAVYDRCHARPSY